MSKNSKVPTISICINQFPLNKDHFFFSGKWKDVKFMSPDQKEELGKIVSFENGIAEIELNHAGQRFVQSFSERNSFVFKETAPQKSEKASTKKVSKKSKNSKKMEPTE